MLLDSHVGSWVIRRSLFEVEAGTRRIRWSLPVSTINLMISFRTLLKRVVSWSKFASELGSRLNCEERADKSVWKAIALNFSDCLPTA